ncbi:MAG: band-7 C-terminal domain-containing protein, partial [Terriglobales bacterium]
VQPGGREALQLQVAKDFVVQFGNVAKAGTTVLLPANLNDIGGLVESALQIIKTDRRAEAAAQAATGG